MDHTCRQIYLMKLELIIEQTESLPSISSVNTVMSSLLSAAQAVYDQWDQNEDGYDHEYGEGGICHDIADAMAAVLNAHNIEAVAYSQMIGDVHVYVIAKFAEGVYEINIPPHVYERGSAYTWSKIPNITLKPHDVSINQIYSDPNQFDEYLEI